MEGADGKGGVGAHIPVRATSDARLAEGNFEGAEMKILFAQEGDRFEKDWCTWIDKPDQNSCKVSERDGFWWYQYGAHKPIEYLRSVLT